jgi:SAM-dependent methyltransferase
MARVRPLHYLLGAEGVALLRSWRAGDAAAGVRRTTELTDLLARGDLLATELDLPELDAATGYAGWAPTYDDLPNPLILVEEPAVRALVDEAPPGRALDAACGTGRHAAYLRRCGHEVVAVDASPAMLDKARARLPEADCRLGDLTSLPLASASVDLAVCALALSHLPDLIPPLAELARVVRPGGRVIVSDFHPLNVYLGGAALFPRSDAGFAVVRSYEHDCGDYVSAARAAHLEIEHCLEPKWTPAHAELMAGPLFALAPDAFRTAFVGLPGAIIWSLRR